MTFLFPERLLLLCIPAILCWWLVRRKGTEIKLPMDGVKTRHEEGSEVVFAYI